MCRSPESCRQNNNPQRELKTKSGGHVLKRTSERVRTIRERRRFRSANHATFFVPQPFVKKKITIKILHDSNRGCISGTLRAIVAQFLNVHMPSNAITLGERLALWHQMTPYVVGGIYADSVEGVGGGQHSLPGF